MKPREGQQKSGKTGAFGSLCPGMVSTVRATRNSFIEKVEKDRQLTEEMLIYPLPGWYMAYESVNSVFSTNEEDGKISFTHIVAKDFYGIVLSAKW